MDTRKANVERRDADIRENVKQIQIENSNRLKHEVIVKEVADKYYVSPDTVYRALRK